MHPFVTLVGGRARLLIVAFSVIASVGCLSSQAVVTASTGDDDLVALDGGEQSRLIVAIESRLRELNPEAVRRSFLPSDFDWTAESPDYFDCRVLAVFIVASSTTISVLEASLDQDLLVIIDSRGGWPLTRAQMSSIVDAVEAAFHDIFPGSMVETDRDWGIDFR